MNSRHIVVKTLLNADEYLALDAACKESDTSHSKALRDLAKTWAASRKENHIKPAHPVERAACGHIKHIPHSRGRTGGFRLRQ